MNTRGEWVCNEFLRNYLGFCHFKFVPSLRATLGFIGLTDMEIIRVEGTSNSETTAAVVAAAKANIDTLKLL